MNIRCRLGLHKYDKTRYVEATRHTRILVTEEKRCKRCRKTARYTHEFDIR
jgi:hypothetical protein